MLVAAALYLGFIAALFVASLIVPGRIEQGAPQPDGTRLAYKLNGLRLFLILTAFLTVGSLLKLFSLSIIQRHFWPLLIVANVFAFCLTAILYVKGRRVAAAAHRPLGSSVAEVARDAFMGTEVNPSWFGLDLKMFAYRPSLMGLGVINVSFAFAQFERYGEISTRMWLFQIFFFVYLVNYFQFEHGMLYTWDIIAEKFGWMLIWGDYVLVPFFYSLAGWTLLENRDPIAPSQVAALVALYLIGFWLFRGSNDQKHRYKVNPQAKIWGKPAETIGGKLLVSGFWGIGRKLNYMGELCMYFAWTLPCGFTSVVPYLLPLWLACLFTHRAWRDEQRCSAKYGALWTEYCARAKFRMIPFLY